MPIQFCLPLVITSSLFFIPALIARRKRRRGLSNEIAALATTSILYHASSHPTIHLVDKCWAHLFGVRYGIISFLQLSTGVNERIGLGHKLFLLATTIGSYWIYMARSVRAPPPQAKYWHMGLHLLVNTGLIDYTLHLE